MRTDYLKTEQIKADQKWYVVDAEDAVLVPPFLHSKGLNN